MTDLKRIYDVDLITQTMRHPRIWPRISDDGCGSSDEFEATINDSIIYLGAYELDEFLGFFLIHPQNSICFEVHTCLLPCAWGEKSKILARQCVDWVFKNTQCLRFVTNVPVTNKLALRLAESAGMVMYGINPKSFLKSGEAIDQIMLGISKESSCQPQQ